jgi:hypothetical protein
VSLLLIKWVLDVFKDVVVLCISKCNVVPDCIDFIDQNFRVFS